MSENKSQADFNRLLGAFITEHALMTAFIPPTVLRVIAGYFYFSGASQGVQDAKAAIGLGEKEVA